MVKRYTIMLSAVVLVMGMSAVQAFNFMNPGDWFDNDRHDRYDRGGYYGGYGPYGGGPYGWGGGGPYGWGGGGPYGWGGGPYGWGGGYGGQPSTIVVTPSSGDSKAAPPPKVPE